ncbi:uncharacterized protein [Palaemon carinicauda]|uniref:uncharacterized protein n=1 Tax=Palaemon carinicauda TaxID=392227 RepID=UPI0035B630BC
MQLTTDASNTACESALEQVVNGALQPIAFFSKNLNGAEQRDTLLPLQNLDAHSNTYQGRKTRWPTSSPGEINGVHLGIDNEDLAHQQQLDPETPAYRTAITALKWEDVPLGSSNTALLCNISAGRHRALVPSSRRKAVFDIVHSLSHPSSRTTARIISSKFIWHGMRKDITRWARSCINCQTSKISRHTTSGIRNFKQPMRHFGHVHIDVVGPLPPSGGDRFLLTVINRSTQWIEATPMQDSSTPSCVNILLSSWISWFGVSDDITTGRGLAFLSDVWGALTKSLGVTAHSTTSYNSAANGMVERAHRSLKASLMPIALMTTGRSNGEPSSAEKVYGETIAVPGEFFTAPSNESDQTPERIRNVVSKFTLSHRTFNDTTKTFMLQDLRTYEFVFIRNITHQPPLRHPYTGTLPSHQQKPQGIPSTHPRKRSLDLD